MPFLQVCFRGSQARGWTAGCIMLGHKASRPDRRLLIERISHTLSLLTTQCDLNTNDITCPSFICQRQSVCDTTTICCCCIPCSHCTLDKQCHRARFTMFNLCCRAAIGSDNEDGTKKFVIRPYTPTSPKDAKGYFDLVVKVYEQGKMSKHFGELKVHKFS